MCYHPDPSITRHKCVYSDEYYIFKPNYKYFFKGEACSNDPHFYQACNEIIGGKITNNELLCEDYICDYGNILYPSYLLDRFVDDLCSKNCKNTDLNVGCNNENNENDNNDKNDNTNNNEIILPTGQSVTVAPDKICDGRCDVWDCEDEAICNGYTYGLYCIASKDNKLSYVPPRLICKGYSACQHREDKENCTVTEQTESSCKHIRTGKLVPIHNYTRCTGIVRSSYFENAYDARQYCALSDIVKQQTNCSDPSRVALTCEINGYKSTVSKYLICFDDTISACDDKLDSKCLITGSCRIHKHYMCDKINDCIDDADEENLICFSLTRATCKRRVGRKIELPIPISWLNDGVKDCENGEDETGKDEKSQYDLSEGIEYKSFFICRTGYPGFVLLEKLCDGLETCGNENKICSVSNRPQSLAISVLTTEKGLTKTLSYCLPGLSNLELLSNKCVTDQQLYPGEDIFGVTKTSVILPDKKVACDHMYGEQYLYTSCTGHCISATCPLRNIPRYEVCPSQYPDRIGTIVNNEYLIFVTKSHKSVYTNRYFVCDDKIKCIEYSKVCDLVYDCDDESDEAHCTNHFKCNRTEKLIPKTKQCDGQIDCFDFSDECNKQCSKEILEGYWLKGLSWLIGFLAVVANLVIIVKCFMILKRCKTTVALMNRVLILVIALGDFFVGCYLFIIATYDGILFRGNYCQQQIKWITSFECSFIGVLSTIGSQLSLFAMTGLSLVRFYGIKNSMRIPGEVTLFKSVRVVSAIIFLVLASAAIAAFPIMSQFEDFFVNGMKFSDEIKIFVGTSRKATILEVIQAYYGRAKKASLKWTVLIEMVKGMFFHDLNNQDLTERADKVHFYGNDGVCMFKYFVQNDDPQKLFVWSILSINFICFVFISLSYLLIGVLSRRSSESTASSNNRQIEKRNKRMNNRIAIIIATDFLCWIPFITTCALHFLEVINATAWYSIFSMVILPMNSVINPLLYDDAVTKGLRVPIQAFMARVRDLLGRVRGLTAASNELPMRSLDQAPRQPTEPASKDIGRQVLVKETQVAGIHALEQPQVETGKYPSKQQLLAPEQVLKETSEKGSKETSEQGPKETSEQGPKESSEQGPKEMSEKGPKETSDQGPKETSEQGPKETSEQGPKEISEQGPRETSEQGPKDSPEQGPKDTPEQGPKDTSEQGPKDTSERGPKETSEQGPKDSPEQGPKETLEKGPKETSEQGPKETSEQGPKERSEQGSKETSEKGPKETSEKGPKDTSEKGPKDTSEQATKILELDSRRSGRLKLRDSRK